jgi:hypothetical protein
VPQQHRTREGFLPSLETQSQLPNKASRLIDDIIHTRALKS